MMFAVCGAATADARQQLAQQQRQLAEKDAQLAQQAAQIALLQQRPG
jgi:hypothetical protein